MTLRVLKGIKQIDGFDVLDMEELKKEHPELFGENGQMDYKYFEKEIRPKYYIYVRQDVNSISFTVQNGPPKEGVNGVRVATLIEAAMVILAEQNKEIPRRENSLAITKLEEALHRLNDRRSETGE